MRGTDLGDRARCLFSEDVLDGPRFIYAEALRIVDSETPNQIENCVIFNRFSDYRYAHHAPDLGDSLYHRAIDEIGFNVAHEISIEFKKVNRQIL